MKKTIIACVLTFSLTTTLSSQTPKTSSSSTTQKQATCLTCVNFCNSFITGHQLITSAMNYNNQPDIFLAFLSEAGKQLSNAENLFKNNKDAWVKKLGTLKSEDIERLFTQYKQLTSRVTVLNEQEMMSANLWMTIVSEKNKLIVEKISK